MPRGRNLDVVNLGRRTLLALALLLIAGVVQAGRVIVPVVVDAPGVNGSYWRTTVDFHMPGEGEDPEYDRPLVIRFYSPSGVIEYTERIPSAGSGQLDPLLERAGISGIGTLELETEGDRAPLVSARIYDEYSPVWAMGETVPGVRPDELLKPGEVAGAISGHGVSRTNLGWYQEEEGEVTFRMYSYVGTLMDEVTLQLSPHEFFQDRLFFSYVPDVKHQVVFVTATIESGSGIGYLSIVNNVTGDAYLRLFQREDAPPACEVQKSDSAAAGHRGAE